MLNLSIEVSLRALIDKFSFSAQKPPILAKYYPLQRCGPGQYGASQELQPRLWGARSDPGWALQGVTVIMWSHSTNQRPVSRSRDLDQSEPQSPQTLQQRSGSRCLPSFEANFVPAEIFIIIPAAQRTLLYNNVQKTQLSFSFAKITSKLSDWFTLKLYYSA